MSDRVEGESREIGDRSGRAWLRYELVQETRRGPAESFLTLGDQFLREGHLDGAREQYERTLSLKPRSIAARINLGVAWVCGGHIERALEEIREALRHKPGHPVALANLGGLLLAQGDSEESLASFEEALAARPDDPLVLNNLAVGLAAAGRCEEAAEALERSLEAAPDIREAVENLALLRDILGDADGAESLRQRAEGMPFGFGAAAIRIVEGNGTNGERMAADGPRAPDDELPIAEVPATESVAPGPSVGVHGIVPESAETEASFAGAEHSRRTGQSTSQVRLGQALLLQGRPEEAAACFRRAVKYDPKNVEAHDSLGGVLDLLGEHGEAAACFERVQSLAAELAGAGMVADDASEEPIPAPPGPEWETQLTADESLLSLDFGPTPTIDFDEAPGADPAMVADFVPALGLDAGVDLGPAGAEQPAAELIEPEGPPAGYEVPGAEEGEVVDEVRAAILRTFGAQALAALDDDDEEDLAQFLLEQGGDAAESEPAGPAPSAMPWSLDVPDEPIRRFNFPNRFHGAPAPVPEISEGSGPSLESLIAQVEAEIRAEVPDQPAPAREAPVGVKHVVFSLGRVDFVVRMDSVLEVQQPPEVAPIPNVPGWILGVANLRGDIISVVDLRTFFGMEPADEDREGRIMVVRSADGELTTGLIVDRVGGMTALPPQDLALPESTTEEAMNPYVRGVISQVGGRMLVALDLEEFLQSDEMRQFQPA